MPILTGFPPSNQVIGSYGYSAKKKPQKTGIIIPEPESAYLERVSVIEPLDVEPVIILCPHQEQYIGLITTEIAKKLKCYAVINRGWDRADTVDFMNDKANCNSIKHLYHDVVREEFLDPIYNFCHKIRKNQFINIYIFIIHGFVVPRPATIEPDICLGFGSGAKRLTCERWRKDAFAYSLQSEGFSVAAGKAKGRYAGAGKDNLNQLFKTDNPDWGVDNSIHSLQIEVDKEWRENSIDASFCAEVISKGIETLVELGDEGFEKQLNLPEYG